MKKILISVLIAIGFLASPNTTLASIDANLSYGSTGTAVIELQEFLIDKGFLKIQASGNFFSLTRNAVIAYQQSVNLPSSGFVGPLTRAKINEELLHLSVTTETTEINKPIYPDGCNSNTGYSSTTGRPCSNSAPVAIISTPKTTSIDVSDVNIAIGDNSAQIRWALSNPSNTRVIVSGGGESTSRIYIGIRGNSNNYLANITDLNSETTYSYEIEALDGDVYRVKKRGDLTTAVGYFVADIISDKDSVKGDKQDFATLTITTKSRTGKVLPSKKVYINAVYKTSTFGGNYNDFYVSNDNGIIVYKTRPVSTSCGEIGSIDISVNDADKKYYKSIQVTANPCPTAPSPTPSPSSTSSGCFSYGCHGAQP